MKITEKTLRGYRVWAPISIHNSVRGCHFVGERFPATDAGFEAAKKLADEKSGDVKSAHGRLRDLSYAAAD